MAARDVALEKRRQMRLTASVRRACTMHVQGTYNLRSLGKHFAFTGQMQRQPSLCRAIIAEAHTALAAYSPRYTVNMVSE